ncbi:MAG: rhodanese-like domain-containing protein [Deltaproteobacteria bacterium]|nr:rhodanese-like domain-containing protein [Deltaproteobacteria bacterium]
MEYRDRGQDYRWYEKRPVRPMVDFNRDNEVGIFAGPLASMYATISSEELKALIGRGEEVTLVSVQPPDEFEKEHICGSLNIPLPAIERDSLNLLGREDLIIVYGRDHRSTASAVGVDKLRTLAFKNTVRFQGGLEEWKKAGYCVEGRAKAA